MKETRKKILNYLYSHRSEPFIFTFDLDKKVGIDHATLLTEITYLVEKGYVEIKSKMLSGDMLMRINAFGIDEVEEHIDLDGLHSVKLEVQNAVHIQTVESIATIKDGIVYVKIRDELYSHVECYLKNEDYFHAVEEAYKIVRVKLKEVAGTEKATEVFGYDANNRIDYHMIFGREPVDTIEEDFFKGVRFIHLAVQFLRNEKSHSLATTLDKNLALQYISLANLAYDLISRGEKK